MAYTMSDFPFSTDNPQIEVTLDEGVYVLELVVEDSAGLRSLPDTVVVRVEREDIPNTSIDGIQPVSGLVGRTVSAVIRGTGLANATAVTFYRQTSVTRPTLSTILTPARLRIPDSTISATITDRNETGIGVDIAISDTAVTGTRTFSVTTPNGTVHSSTMTFNVVTLPTVTITRPTVTITRPTVTITRPTVTITRPTATITLPTATITRPTATITLPTATITRPTATLTLPTATLTRPTATIPTATLTLPTATIPTARPTATFATATLTRPTMTLATATTMTRPTFSGESVMLTSVKGVGTATADRLTAAGIGSVAALASANAKDVADALGYQDITRAQALVDEAKKLMG